MKLSFVHKLIAFLLLLILPVFIAKKYNHYKNIPTSIQEYEAPHSEKVAQKDKQIYIIAIDNQSFDEQALQSIFSQNYQNYKVGFFTLHQEDKEKIYSYFDSTALRKHLSYSYSPKQADLMKNLHRFLHSLNDEDIVIYLGKGNYFANNGVFSLVNTIYQTENVYLCFGEYFDSDTHKKGFDLPYSHKSWSLKRSQQNFWLRSSMKIFYARLYKQLNINESEFESITNIDEFLAKQFKPIAAMSKRHIRFIPEVLYVHH